ncbi:cell division protein FtsB [Solemya velum gill symbiont]|uniref:Cell division protein FtsB n=1 Tax=Solemya velum gill symbiont TaxID=2340 RepID=A0A0B0HDM8_SOVGS|nr:cell division protein FtsB [Solemya velum gill symbiont]KHF26019.1 cell division protein FtsB [Solemya velum gill symbiont]OOY33957.1 cell division protein FtsB [Solemya velum gill symbiont]OOY36611.1 cell division protein FtsB [Solemya velum gill symbiont]OOY39907.1 cell division protein FtsB [Solemya velum gill symbiont]OOY44199.1 cell division protein FtsB [Solemya velum gill symbiont]
MRWLLAALILLLIYLQFQLWVGRGSRAEIAALQQEIATQKQQIQEYQERNDALHAEVKSLKEGLDAVEERARADLGMIGENELFFQILESPGENQK